MSREYKFAWGGDWPGLTVSVPEDAELAVAEVGYETARHPSGFVGARILTAKFVFLDVDDESPDGEDAKARPISIVKEQ